MNTVLRFACALLEDGWADDVVLQIDDNGIITAVQANQPEGTINGDIAVPAMPNVHSHAHQRAMAGLAEKRGPGNDDFWSWRTTMYNVVQKLTPDDLQAIASQLYLEMLKAGYTAVGEFQYLHHQQNGRAYDNCAAMSLACLAAAEQTGIAITMLPVAYRYGGFGRQAMHRHQLRFYNDPESFLKIVEAVAAITDHHELHQFGIAPHSLRAVDIETINEVIDGLPTVSGDMPIHIHIAEQQQEVKDCMDWCLQRPVEYLLSRIDPARPWCFIHATHLSQQETTDLARSGVTAGLCPTTEANLGDGVFPARKFLDEGGKIAIGSDSHISISAAEELRMLEYSQRLFHRSRNVLAAGSGTSTGASMFRACTRDGGPVLNQPIGKIAVGCRADLMTFDSQHPLIYRKPNDDAVDSWVFSAGNNAIQDVYVAGRRVIENGRHPDETAIFNRYQSTMNRLF